ncbi:hypothetical protein [Mucispirillum schaedleri]|uniref:hypothetical protein n=1 Tax=Mucispirillum schaedleri TaxID=248039 RepID=UPI001F56224F|nr:hypothetical protein [Mucispirillum schaedleri]
MIGKVIEKVEYGLFTFIYDIYELQYEYDEFSNLFLKIPNIMKVDILEYFEHLILGSFFSNKIDSNDIIPEFFYQSKDNIDSAKATFQSEYIDVIGQLFLAGYIDYGIFYSRNENKNRVDYATNLSHYKEDKYRAWIYFRDNYFYKEKAYIRDLDKDDIPVYKGKEYSMLDRPYKVIDGEKYFYSALTGKTTWDKPRHWSSYNTWIGISKKGIEYYEKDLQPRLYKKYKDLSVELDDNYNIIRWIGHINR